MTQKDLGGRRVKSPRSSYTEAKTLIGSRVKEARQNCGLSQRALAELLFCDQATISRIESGILAPDVAQIKVMSGVFQLSVLWLLGYPSFVVHATKD
jgi:transcriptional regulator with XRE-family HTH domain